MFRSRLGPAVVDEDDDVLARRAALGDRRAFVVVVERHGPAMFRFARRVLLDDGDAEDAVQDAFVAAWQHLSGFRGDSALRTWLFRLTLNKAHNIRRKNRPEPQEPIDTSAPATADPATNVVGGALIDAVDRALAALPPNQRIAWILREVDGLSYEEIAHVMRTSRDVVRGLLHRARHTLAERLAAWR
ncbi:RNA polymerase sigma factor [Jiangella alkaliphila]|uniref:RNA polymerase sigma-70 factor, ECF subfamily n=1 Tax=Jiangella alkaliphila TaxID=419479 RepID=A0A1H2L786_9ACTN|nr:RNA polymerase sigma factor [Jiangella alkaliphila]SDU76863.1 RNA polymerase sigma-70 factor, ECF subfamily [Jiangella alkaliphila]